MSSAFMNLPVRNFNFIISNYNHEKRYHRSLTLRILFYPTKILNYCYPSLKAVPDPLPTTGTPITLHPVSNSDRTPCMNQMKRYEMETEYNTS